MDIALLRRPIEQRLAAATGLHATLGKIDASIFGASLEISGLTLTAPDSPADRPPVVSVGTIHVELSIRKAFQGEILIRQLAINRPIVHLHRDAQGRWALPHKAGASTRSDPAPPPSANPATADARKPLSIVIDRATLTAGEIHVIDESSATTATAYHATATGIGAELRREGDRYELTFQADRVERLDVGAAGDTSLGPFRAVARLEHIENLAVLDRASLNVNATLGDPAAPLLRAEATSAAVVERVLRFAIDATADAAMVRAWAPGALPAALDSARGTITLRARGSADLAASRFVLDEFALAAASLSFGG